MLCRFIKNKLSFIRGILFCTKTGFFKAYGGEFENIGFERMSKFGL